MKDEMQNAVDLKQRTKRFALDIVRLFAALPQMTEVTVIGRQLLRSGTSVGAHYREACRARSNAEFISKIEVGLQELDETVTGSNFCSNPADAAQRYCAKRSRRRTS